MKRLAHIIMLIILISSCVRNPQQKKLDCDYIEITYDNGWNGGSTIIINKDLTYKKCFYHIISFVDSCSCFIDTLSDKYYGRINILIDSLKNTAIDSIYNGNCQDCGGFLIRVKYPDRIIKTMIIGAHEFNNRIANFARFICDMPISKYHPDSCKIFETTKYLIPPPMDYKRKFVPPTDEEMKLINK